MDTNRKMTRRLGIYLFVMEWRLGYWQDHRQISASCRVAS